MTDLADDGNAAARAIVEAFFAAKERRDLDTIAALFADDIVYTFPLPASGAQEDWFVYHGKDETLAYQRRTRNAFSQLKMCDVEITVAEGGGTVFAETRGDYVTTDGRPYRNIYMFKFVLADRKVARVVEYCNPVTYAVLVGLPIAGREPPS